MNKLIEMFEKEVKRIKFFKEECQSCVSDECVEMYDKILEILKEIEHLSTKSYILYRWIPKSEIERICKIGEMEDET